MASDSASMPWRKGSWDTAKVERWPFSVGKSSAADQAKDDPNAFLLEFPSSTLPRMLISVCRCTWFQIGDYVGQFGVSWAFHPHSEYNL